MTKEIIWTVGAFRDLQNIVEYISHDSPYYAAAFYEDIMDKAQTLKEFPHRGRVVPDFDDPSVRELFGRTLRVLKAVRVRDCTNVRRN